MGYIVTRNESMKPPTEIVFKPKKSLIDIHSDLPRLLEKLTTIFTT